MAMMLVQSARLECARAEEEIIAANSIARGEPENAKPDETRVGIQRRVALQLRQTRERHVRGLRSVDVAVKGLVPGLGELRGGTVDRQQHRLLRAGIAEAVPCVLRNVRSIPGLERNQIGRASCRERG